MKFVNEGLKKIDKDGKPYIDKCSVTVLDLGIVGLEYGKTCEVQDGYAEPHRANNGSRLPAIIEKLAPQLKPADPEERRVWEKVPPPGRPDGFREAPVASIEALVKQGYPLGVAEGMHRKAMAEREQERQAKQKALHA